MNYFDEQKNPEYFKAIWAALDFENLKFSSSANHGDWHFFKLCSHSDLPVIDDFEWNFLIPVFQLRKY